MLEQRYSDNEVSRRDIPSFIEPRPPLIQNPFMRPKPQKGTNLLELFEEDSEIEEPELVQVYLRLKPCRIPNTLYEVRSDKCLVTSLDTATAGHGRRTQHNVSKMYTFSRIFGSECNQKDIFEQVVKENLRKLPEGHNFTLLTYGASGSGKTYTLMGTVGAPGLVPRSLEYVFKLVDAAQQPVYKPAENGADQLNLAEQDFELQWVKRLRHISAPLREKYRRMSVGLHSDLTASSIDLSNRVRHYVWVSFVEIYNEAIYDLLAPPDKRTKLRIREDTSGNVYVKGATQAFVRSGEEAYDVMVAGKHNLIVAATGVHAQSSRSHCIFTITMLTETGDSTGGVRSSCVRLCDLAGCERARATRNTGARMQESRAINSSLHVLERCLHMLRRKQRMRNDALVPYRESKLTRLLGTGLSGSRGEAVSMVVTLNPSPEYAHETKHVLSLAAVAQDIQINNTMLLATLESSTQDTTIGCSSEVMKLRVDNERLHFELVQAQSRNRELMAAMEEKQQEAANTMRELVEEAKDMTRQYYEAQIESLRTEMDDMIEEYESRLSKVPKEAPSSGSGTPSRFLQSKVAQLMTEITILEETLAAEKLARARAEKEVQHLHTCIEERDEKAFKDATPLQEVVNSSENEYESDEETNDPLNQSLEPVFKKEQNKSMAKQNDTISIHTIDNIEEEYEDNVYESTSKVKDTTVGEENVNDSIKNDSKYVDISENDSANVTYESVKSISEGYCDDTVNEIDINEIKDKMDDLNDNAKSANDNDSFKCRGTYFVKDSNFHSDDYIETEGKNTSGNRGTYFVKDNKINLDNKKSEEKNTSESRGTYFVRDNKINSEDNNEIEDKHISAIQGTCFVSASKEEVKEKSKTSSEVTETLVSKIIRSMKSKRGNDSSLTQFEQLEQACDEVVPKKNTDNSEIKIFKEKRIYFDNEPSKVRENNEDIKHDTAKEKRIFFDNIGSGIQQAADKRIESTKILDDERSPSIVKDSVATDNFEPSKIKKLLGESFTKPEITSSVQKARLGKKYVSVDIFESPVVNDNCDNNIEIATQSIEKLVLNQQSAKKLVAYNLQHKSPRKENILVPLDIQKSLKSPIRYDITKTPVRLDITKSPLKAVAKSPMKDVILFKNIDTFELPTAKDIGKSLMKDGGQISIVNSTFKTKIQNDSVNSNKDVTQSQNKLDTMIKTKQEPEMILKIQTSVVSDVKKEKLEPVSSIDVANQTSNETNNPVEEFENIYKDVTGPRDTEFELLLTQSIVETDDKAKYNLRNKYSKVDETKHEKEFRNTKEKDKVQTNEEVLLESQAKCESKQRKRTLRLRRKKNQEDESDNKLKDIVNLQTEFSDVTMGLPAPKKSVKDIPSPEKGAEENLPPLMGIQSCPAKSITRSRRKLFTPRAEPLEESGLAGDSNERLYVPRPSYHRPRARRKL